MAEIKDALLAAIQGTYLWFIVVALIGGTANYISKVRANKQKTFSVVELVGEWFVAGFSGLIVALYCQGAGMSFEITAASAGIAGHAGSRGVYMIEQYVLSKLPGSQFNDEHIDRREQER